MRRLVSAQHHRHLQRRRYIIYNQFDSHTHTHARTHVIIDLATYALGSSIVDVTNEFFAPARSMLSPNPPISLPDKFVGMYWW